MDQTVWRPLTGVRWSWHKRMRRHRAHRPVSHDVTNVWVVIELGKDSL